MKNKVITIILILAMLVPSVVAVVNYVSLRGGKVDSHNVIEVTVVDHLDNGHSFTRDNGKGDMLDYFITAIGNAESVSSLPTSIEMGNFYNVTIYTTDNKDGHGYKFYYTTNAEDCYFVNGEGESFKMTKPDSEKFLLGGYSAALYENGILPNLTVSGLTTNPDKANWYFKNANGEYVAYDCTAKIKDEMESINLEGGIAMSFPIEPDSFTVKITDAANGEVIFEDNYANIAGLTVTKEMNVSVEAVAKWYEDSERTYYGEQTYSFNATFGAPAQFYAGVTSIQVGEFISVTGFNVNNEKDITFQSEPDINYSPVFFRDENKVQTLIPFSWNLSAGDYTLTFSYGGSTQQIVVNVGERSNPFRDRTVTIPKAVVESYGTDDIRNKCETELREVAKKASDKKYFENGETLFYDDTDLTFTMGYGHNYTVSGTDIKFRNTGVDFSEDSGTAIKANLAGEVIYAGYLDYSGYTVVIEHGYGLKSWYAHMGSVTVKVGDVVEKGAAVGTAGESGFTAVEGVHIGMTIYDVPVCTFAIWKNSYRPEGQKGIVMYEEN